jgi:hypothetical protein
LAPPERKLGLPAQQESDLWQECQRLVDTGVMSPGTMRSIFGPEVGYAPKAVYEPLAQVVRECAHRIADHVLPPPATSAFDEPEGECRKSAESATKTRWDLVPSGAIEEIAQVLAFGARKYGEHNWARGAAWHRYFRALCSHVFAWWRGEDRDPETGLSHLAHAGCCLVFLMEYQRNGWGKDDRFLGPDTEPFIKHDGTT